MYFSVFYMDYGYGKKVWLGTFFRFWLYHSVSLSAYVWTDLSESMITGSLEVIQLSYLSRELLSFSCFTYQPFTSWQCRSNPAPEDLMPYYPKNIIQNIISVAFGLWRFLKHVSVLKPWHIFHELEKTKPRWCWDSRWVTPKYATMAHWLFWIDVAWETADARRKLWPTSVPLKAENKSPMWKVHSLYPEIEGHPYHQR